MIAFTDAPSPNFDARRGPPDILVLHYTGMETAEEAIARLRDAEAKVSAHYVVDEDGSILRLVPEERRAWHAGRGAWQGETDVNAASIGIEIVNPGHEWGYRPFPALQMAAVAELCLDILSRHPIPPGHVVAHSDIAPDRKQDPGELFDWQGLAANGVGLWPAGVSGHSTRPRQDGTARALPLLRAIGYPVDPARPDVVLSAFQRHWRPDRVDGIADGETRARLVGLLQLASVESVTGVLD